MRNKSAIILVGFVFAGILLSGCNGKRSPLHVTDEAATGIWGMEDTPKMISFMGIKEEALTGYAIEFLPLKGHASIKFSPNGVVYEVKIQKMGKGRYCLVYNGKKRSFVIEKDRTYDIYSWHYDDYVSDIPDSGHSDGVKEDYKTLDSMLVSMIENDKIANENAKEGLMGNFTPPEEKAAK